MHFCRQKDRQCPNLAERGCVENQPQPLPPAAADASRTAALRKFQIRILPKNITAGFAMPALVRAVCGSTVAFTFRSGAVKTSACLIPPPSGKISIRRAGCF
jgi:hypothetical protein